MSERSERAKQAAWRAAHDLAGDSVLTARLIRSSELAVIRRLLAAQLPGGEARFWELVKQEIER